MTDIDALLDAQAQANDEERNASKWDPKKAGEKLEGYLLKTGWYDGGDYDPSLWLLIKDDSGTTHRVYCKTVLQREVVEQAPKIGSGLAIRYEGKQTSNSGRGYHAYTLVLIPDEHGVVHTDNAYWHKNGVYRGPSSYEGGSTTAGAVEEDDYF